MKHLYKMLLISISLISILSGCASESISNSEGEVNDMFTAVKLEDIETIDFHNTAKWFTVTGKQDIERIYSVLMEMQPLQKLHLNEDEMPDGFSFLIDICNKDGTTFEYALLAGKICADNDWYATKSNYLDKFYSLFDELSQNYENTGT